jgi:epoxyqueuosine reductase QueG
VERLHAILRHALPSTLYEYGFANLEGLLPEKYAHYTHGISLLRRLDDSIIDGILEGPTRDYYEQYLAVNAELEAKADHIAQALSELGVAYLAVKATLRDDELTERFASTLSYDLSHKMVATRAGLGWIGKTDLLVSKRFGPRLRLASVLVAHPLPSGTPIEEGHCGSCRLCVEHCPAQAATGEGWTVGLAREAFFNPFRCRDHCRKLCRQQLGLDVSLCGKCVALCPQGTERVSKQ